MEYHAYEIEKNGVKIRMVVRMHTKTCHFLRKVVLGKGSFIYHVLIARPEEEGVYQMSITLHKPFKVKWSTKGKR